jgi:hypothetical protein
VSASEIDRLRRDHEEQIKDLQVQAGRVPGLEAELAKATDAESMLRQELEQRLAKVKEELSAKYDAEVEEHCAAQDAKNKERDAKHQDLMDLQEADHAAHKKELGV